MIKKHILLFLFVLLFINLLTGVTVQADDAPIFEIDETLQPEIDAIEPLYGEVERPLSVLKDPDGTIVHFIVDEVMLDVGEDEAVLDDFLSRYSGELLHDNALPELPDGESYPVTVPPSTFRLLRIDLDTVSLDTLEEDAQLFGLSGTYTFSSEQGLKLMALLLRSKIEGYDAFPDVPIFAALQEHPIGDGTFLDPEDNCNPAFPEVCDSMVQQTRANDAWEYLRAHGVDQTQTKIAFVDRGYAVDANGNVLFGLRDLPNIPATDRFDFARNSTDISGVNRVMSECNVVRGVLGRCWHGATVALTALAAHDNKYGTAGTAVNAKPYFYYASTMSELSRAIDTATASDVDVINISQTANCSASMCRNLSYFGKVVWEATKQDVIIVAAAGNAGMDIQNSWIFPCASAYGVICVGALATNSLNSAPFSNFGAVVDIWAPGTNVLIAPQPTFNGSNWQTNNGLGLNSLTPVSGTSYASPFTAGVVANMKALDAKLTWQDALTMMQNNAMSSTHPAVAPTGVINALASVYELNSYKIAGEISSPKPWSRWETSVDFGIDTYSIPPASVSYSALFDHANGQRYWQSVASGSGANFAASWDVSALPSQTDVYVRAYITGANGSAFLTQEVGPISINVDATPPTGQLLTPQTNGRIGLDVPLVASVQDASGIYSVKFLLYENGSNQPFYEETVTQPSSDGTYGANWNSQGRDGQTITVGVFVLDDSPARNFAQLTPATNVLIDHTGPEATIINPPTLDTDAIWVTNANEIQLLAEAQDEDGVAGVEFTAVYRDSNGTLTTDLLGTTTLTNGIGQFRYVWDVSNIPDQAERGGTPLRVTATAIDTLGNRGAADDGWILGFDREAPTVSFVLPQPQNNPQGNALPIEVSATDTLGVVNAVNQLTVTARYRQTGQTSATDHVLATVTGVTGWSGNLPIANLPDQLITLYAEAIDDAGNRMTVTRQLLIDNNGPAFSNVGHSGTPLHANGSSSMSFSYTLSEAASSVTIFIVDDMGNAVTELTSSFVNTNPQVVPWDGRDKFGNLVPSGTYHYRLEAVDGAGNVGTHPGGSFDVINDITPPVISLTVTPAPFSYAQHGALEVVYSQDEAAYAEIEVFNSGGTMVQFVSWNQSAGSYLWKWDGIDWFGNQLPVPATYTFNLRVTDLAGNVSTTSVQVDFTP